MPSKLDDDQDHDHDDDYDYARDWDKTKYEED
jgi:hypothetical protein